MADNKETTLPSLPDVNSSADKKSGAKKSSTSLLDVGPEQHILNGITYGPGVANVADLDDDSIELLKSSSERARRANAIRIGAIIDEYGREIANISDLVNPPVHGASTGNENQELDDLMKTNTTL